HPDPRTEMSVFRRPGSVNARIALEHIACRRVREHRGLLSRPEGDHRVIAVVVVNQRGVDRPSRAESQRQVRSYPELVLEVRIVPLRPSVDNVPATLGVSTGNAEQEIGSRVPGRVETSGGETEG